MVAINKLELRELIQVYMRLNDVTCIYHVTQVEITKYIISREIDFVEANVNIY